MLYTCIQRVFGVVYDTASDVRNVSNSIAMITIQDSEKIPLADYGYTVAEYEANNSFRIC